MILNSPGGSLAPRRGAQIFGAFPSVLLEHAKLEPRAEVFNASYHAAFARPDNHTTDRPGAIASSVIPQSQLQFGLQLYF